ncbi:hypothetical protein L2E82_51961 [Cichorium intybus]|nr:hypothetical protein L2E82_51961 [Cichorium intybus]
MNLDRLLFGSPPDLVTDESRSDLVEGFWVCYCHLAPPSSLPRPTDLHLLKQGIRPLWEDSANYKGGKLIIRFKKAVSGRFWEDLVLALVGDQLDYSDNICGIVLSVRFNEDILSVWNRNASNNQVCFRIWPVRHEYPKLVKAKCDHSSTGGFCD